jgi:polyprenyl-phospho-N-acetylgalactosaminyl synthase
MKFVVVPVYNEEKRIKQVVENLVDLGMEIVVVDDCSSDGTRKELLGLPVHVLGHDINLGQGAALKTGSEYARISGAEVIAHYDGDGQHRKEDLVKLMAQMDQGEHDVVLGSRFMELKSKIPMKKKVILFLAKMLSKTLLQLHYTDPQSGLRVIKADKLDQLDWQKYDFQHCTEILGLIRKNKLKYIEMPIKVHYDEYSQNKKVRPQFRMGVKLLLNKILD